ncbi:hypothetical protein VTI74DRAFT_3777 [Chaetomium olivicolor]
MSLASNPPQKMHPDPSVDIHTPGQGLEPVADMADLFPTLGQLALERRQRGVAAGIQLGRVSPGSEKSARLQVSPDGLFVKHLDDV